jgi:hypothetical protein
VALHFTYAEPDPNSLRQGDIIRRTEGLEALLVTIHPYYKRADYPYFQILTQTCDLVRRDARPCKSRYITLAAVRPLQLVLERERLRFQRSPVEQRLGFCSDRYRDRLVQFAERLLNNNEPGYFYLHREPSVGLLEDHCVFLQLSVPLRSEDHYQLLLSAKVLQLSDSFQHKLGWLVGNIYSRVGTEDWVPKAATPEQFEAMQDRLVDETTVWVPQEYHRRVVSRLRRIPLEELTPDTLEDAIAQTKAQRDAEVAAVVDDICSVLSKLQGGEDLVARFRDNLIVRRDITSRIKPRP